LRSGATKSLVIATAVATALSLSGCQMGEYWDVTVVDCTKGARAIAEWLSAQHPVTGPPLVDAKADPGLYRCDAIVVATVPDDTSRSQFVSLADKIVAHLQQAADAEWDSVDLKHGEQTTHLDRMSVPSELPWLDY
jgi:hypothetical protein